MAISTAPLIGIPTRHDKSTTYRRSMVHAQNEAYIKAVSQAGGIPFLIPLNLDTPALRRLYELADGLLLPGGGDIHPALYHQSHTPTESDVQPDRDEMEVTLSRWATADEKPLLAICRGIQVLAVSAGGTLIQDLPTELPDATLHNYVYIKEGSHDITELIHDVALDPESHLSRVLETTQLRVNSMHHQAVKSVPSPLQIVGHSSDGVVEAVELPNHPFYIGIQWHPEVLVDDHESARKVLGAFVQACNHRGN